MAYKGVISAESGKSVEELGRMLAALFELMSDESVKTNARVWWQPGV